MCLPYHHCRLVKTVENAAAVELRCLRISAQSVNISQVWIKILTTAKNAEYVGKEHDQMLFFSYVARQCSYQRNRIFFSRTQSNIFFYQMLIFLYFLYVAYS